MSRAAGVRTEAPINLFITLLFLYVFSLASLLPHPQCLISPGSQPLLSIVPSRPTPDSTSDTLLVCEEADSQVSAGSVIYYRL